MQHFKYINRPVFIERSLYEKAIQWMVAEVQHIQGLKSFYRFGNITVPGISDLDFLFVFENNSTCTNTGFENLPVEFKCLFTHGIMAVSEEHFIRNHHYTLWSEHHLTAGLNIELPSDSKTSDEIQSLKIQTAIEFLIANYMDLKIQMTYGIINLRSFLQHMKGIIYDLEYLQIQSGAVMSLLLELKHVAQHWFTQQPGDKAIDIWINKFDKEYEKFCKEIFIKYPMYLPVMSKYQVARNAVLIPDKKLRFHHSGTVFPAFISSLGKKIVRLQNRFNNFEFYMPISNSASLPIIEERFRFLQEMKSYNRKNLPGFMTITTSITSKII